MSMYPMHRDAMEVINLRAQVEELRTELGELRARQSAAAIKLRIAYTACEQKSVRDMIHEVAQEIDR